MKETVNKSCRRFRRRLEAVEEDNGDFIEERFTLCISRYFAAIVVNMC